MFRTRLAAVALSGVLMMLASGCMQFGSGQGLFARRDPCCDPCGCGSAVMASPAPTVISQDWPTYQPAPGQTLPPPRITTNPNSPVVPYVPGP